MGKSDPIIFKEYYKMTCDTLAPKSVAFLGFSGENAYTKTIHSEYRDFYDLTLRNWDVNEPWSLKRKYDLIVCTRVAYFAKDPVGLVDKCLNHLNSDGRLFIDWGFGDHWRFKDFKVGWVRDGEHEFAYKPDNFLHSGYWHPDLNGLYDVKQFWKYAKNVGNYTDEDDLQSVIKAETPALITDEFDDRITKISVKFLWPDSPQLYIMVMYK